MKNYTNDYDSLVRYHKAYCLDYFFHFKSTKYSRYGDFLKKRFTDEGVDPEILKEFMKKRSYANHIQRYIKPYENVADKVEAKVNQFEQQAKEVERKRSELIREIDKHNKAPKEIKLGNKLPNYKGFNGKFRWMIDHSPEIFLATMFGIVLFIVFKLFN